MSVLGQQWPAPQPPIPNPPLTPNPQFFAHRDKAVNLDRETFRDVMAVMVDGAFMMAEEAARRLIRDGTRADPNHSNISSVLSGLPMRQVAA